MDDIIHLLPDSVANQIAAGEVVQRPSSIIKEMVENSLDAGAKNIQVLVVDGGKTNVQVIDDGKGMSETDARMSFERHATSKILKAADLFSLTTMGFRGEALASIAAVAQVDLKTRRKEDELGTFLQIAGSKIEKQEPIACPVGSNFAVKNLFFNVPARRKFLKSNQTELTNVIADFQRIVLVHPDVSFTLYNNGAEMFRLPAASVRQRIVDVFGKKINTELLPLEVETSLVSISGYVGKPESSKKKGTHQFFFVNGRYMRHPYFHSAVMRAFDNLIPTGEHVSYFIYFAVDPSAIDVNVHPTKTEIKFDNEQPIWQVLSAAVRETVGKFSNVPMIDFDVEGRPDIPALGADGAFPAQPKLQAPTYNPFTGSSKKSTRTEGWEKMYEGISHHESSIEPSIINGPFTDAPLPSEMNRMDATPSMLNGSQADSMFDRYPFNAEGTGNTVGSALNGESTTNMFLGNPQESTLNASANSYGMQLSGSALNAQIETNVESAFNLPEENVQQSLWNSELNANKDLSAEFDLSVPKFQYRGQYIILPCKKGIMAIDQHRAHVNVLYNQNMHCMTVCARPTQRELFQIILQFEKTEAVVLEDMMDEITSLGFDLTNLGGGSYALNGMPADITGVNVDKLLHEMVLSAMEHTGNARQEAQEALALTMAKSSAIVRGQILSATEIDHLLSDLFSLTTPARTPDGKIVYAIVPSKTIEDLF